jgi:phytoene synthase
MNALEAYAACEDITRRQAKNFAYGIALLRRPERQALSAVYALARRIDDIGDGSGPAASRLAQLGDVRAQLLSIDTATTDPVLVALSDALRRYGLPMGAFAELIDGCEMDVKGTTYETIDELVVYCRKVAGSVGRLSLAVFGTAEPERAEALADSLGVALQLTNIARDVLEDQALGRVYLPRQDALAVGCPPDLDAPAAVVGRLVAFECAQARLWFEEGLQLLELLDRRSRACVAAMAGIYKRLLDRIELDPGAVMAGRLSLPRSQKAMVAVRSLAGLRP